MQNHTCQALIKINQNTDGIQTVNARDLHALLEVGKDFSSWVKVQIERARLAENRDYVKLTQKGERQILVDYHLTIDAAKHVAMMSGTDKGFEVRDYFIECERRAKQPFGLPQSFSEALLLAYEQAKVIEGQQAAIAEYKPKAEFYDAVTESKDAVDIGTVAKVLNLGIGRTRLFSFMRADGILMMNNQPYQHHIDAGHFRVIETKFSKPDGSMHVNLKTVAYQKGIDYIRKRYLAKYGRAA